jgi:FkbM family methyltransferase
MIHRVRKSALAGEGLPKDTFAITRYPLARLRQDQRVEEYPGLGRRVDKSYWSSWLRWHLLDKRRRDHVPRRRAEWDFIERIHRTPAGSLAIDCGANVGDVASAFVRCGFAVHAFEPDPYALEFLVKRYGAHPQVTIHPQAVGPKAGTAKLYRIEDFWSRPKTASMSSSLLRRPSHDDGGATEVEVIDLSSFIRNLDRPVDLLKLDVEGAEVDIVNQLIDDGTYKTIGFIYAETHERHSPELAESTMKLRRRIEEAGIANINLDWR